MSDLKVVTVNGKSYLDSRDVAEFLGRRHPEVLRAIRKIEDQLQNDPFVAATENIKFEKHFILHSDHYRNLEWPYYLMTEKACELYSAKLQKLTTRWYFYQKAQEALNQKENA